MDSMDHEYEFSEASNAFGPSEFANALSQNLDAPGTNAQKLFGKHGLLSRYQRLAQDKSAFYQIQTEIYLFRAQQFPRTGVTAEWWTLETRLWELIHRLYEYRSTLHNKQQSHTDNVEDLTSLEETRIILKWLTDTAPRITEPEYIQSSRWFVTRENIKMRKVTGGQQISTSQIISELDPDATLRQGKGLMTEDEENERKLLKQVFSYLRLGDIKTAQQVCRDSNNHWRAASLSGMSAFDNNTEKLNNNWRKMSFQLARQPQVDRYERAVYGVACGDLDSVVPVCQTWEDQMWAHFNAIYIWKLEEVPGPMRIKTDLEIETDKWTGRRSCCQL
jgi:nuclear pore complex protein Nup107